MTEMNEAKIIRVRNVNQALSHVRAMLKEPRQREYYWRNISPRGMETLEYRGMVVTEYREPCERVLWSPYRNANPFFHLMESLWILAGRNDVAFLKEFNPRMADYSDDGIKFHAPYGFRLRSWPTGQVDKERGFPVYLDQIEQCIKLLRDDPMSRQAVMSIWDPTRDLGAKTKDMPCNDLIMLKVREGALHMTVCCRSNDVVWGAYGANVVQFSTILEFMAGAIGVQVGTYRQISDSFHVYTDQDAWLSVMNNQDYRIDFYQDVVCAQPYPMFTGVNGRVEWDNWLKACEHFCEGATPVAFKYFKDVAGPMRTAWRIYRDVPQTGDSPEKRRDRALRATDFLEDHMVACDWRYAAICWLMRNAGVENERA